MIVSDMLMVATITSRKAQPKDNQDIPILALLLMIVSIYIILPPCEKQEPKQ
jgi:hypothetical protein